MLHEIKELIARYKTELANLEIEAIKQGRMGQELIESFTRGQFFALSSVRKTLRNLVKRKEESKSYED